MSVRLVLRGFGFFVFFLLFVISMHRAWAGWTLAQAVKESKKENFQQAFKILDDRKKNNLENPAWLYERGKAALQTGRIQDARVSFERLTTKIPGYGRGWIYLAMAQREAGDSQIESALSQAVRLEPGSAWVRYAAAKELLSASNLTEDKKEQGLEWMKQAVLMEPRDTSILNLPDSSHYLKPALKFLWHQFRTQEYLERITPRDWVSYGILLDVLSSHNLWALRENFEVPRLEFSREFYEKECRRGEKFLEHDQARQAYYAFRRAFWSRDWAYPWAKVGILAAEQRLGTLSTGKHPVFQKDYRGVLRDILEEQDEEIGGLEEALSLLVLRSGNAELKELLAKRGKEAAGQVSGNGADKTSGKWWGSFEKNNAQEFPRKTIELYLTPGKKKVRVFIKGSNIKAGSNPYFLFKLNEKTVGSLCLKRNGWQKTEFQIQTTGGSRWLAAEILNFSEEYKMSPPVLGPVKIRYDLLEK